MDVSLSAGTSVTGIEFWPDEYPLPAANARAMSFPLASLFGATGSGSLAAAWPTMRTHYLSVGNLVFGMHDD